MTIRQEYLSNIEDTFAAALFTVQGKSEDYAEVSDPFSNFRFAALSAGVTVEQVFLVLLGVKMARLKQLIVNAKTANNESAEDTLTDQINYTAILKAYREFKNSSNPSYAYAGEPEPSDAEVPSGAADFKGEPTELTHLDYVPGFKDRNGPAPKPAEEELTPVQKLLNLFTRND